MATRTRLPSSPALDSSPSEADNYTRSGAMSEYGFNSLIRGVLNSSADRARQIQEIVTAHKKRLGIRRGRAKAVISVPEGSDQLDVQSVNWWAGKIDVKDRAAVNQLRILDATLAYRLGE